MEMKAKELPFISIVIVTLNRREKLLNCLNSIFKLDYPEDRFETIVVDGGSKDDTREMIFREFPKVKFIVERRKGLPYARNTGWKHSKGLIVVYTDDDCIVEKSWLMSLVNGFTSPKIGAVGGPVLYLHPELVSDVFYQTPVGNFDLGKAKKFLKKNENLITANMAVRSEVFDEVQFFEALVYSDSEDYEFCWSLMEAGYKIQYLPHAIVLHDINPKRVNMYYLLRRAFFSGISHYIVDRKRYSKTRLIPKFLRAFLENVFHFFKGQEDRSRIADFFLLDLCFVAYISSILLIYRDF